MDEDQETSEWTRHQIIIPDDDYDEDDELDERLEKIRRKQQGQITRGSGLFSTS